MGGGESGSDGDRRVRCEICGAAGEVALRLEGVAEPLQARLCPAHAEVVARRLRVQLASMRAVQADLGVGRRLRDGEAMAVIRQWARDEGFPVSSSGSIAPRILAAYREAVAARQRAATSA